MNNLNMIESLSKVKCEKYIGQKLFLILGQHFLTNTSELLTNSELLTDGFHRRLSSQFTDHILSPTSLTAGFPQSFLLQTHEHCSSLPASLEVGFLSGETLAEPTFRPRVPPPPRRALCVLHGIGGRGKGAPQGWD